MRFGRAPRGWFSSPRTHGSNAQRLVWRGSRSRHAQAPRSLSAAVGPGPFPKLLRRHAPAVGGEASGPARLPLQRRRRRPPRPVAVLLRVRGGLRRCDGAEFGDGIPRGSGSARGCPELRYRRRRLAGLRTPRRLSHNPEPVARVRARESVEALADLGETFRRLDFERFALTLLGP